MSSCEVGETFGRWTVIGPAHKGRRQCRCACGTTRAVRVFYLKSGRSKSCGCKNYEILKVAGIRHGLSGTKTYRTWAGIRARVKHDPFYVGVTVCSRWDRFENFLADMGERPAPTSTIDRIDNAKGYEPGNCRWATIQEQQNNRRSNVLLTFNGRTMNMKAWAEATGIKYSTLARRLDSLGWPVERALTAPIRGAS